MSSPPQTEAEIKLFNELTARHRAQDGSPHYAKMAAEHNFRYVQQVSVHAVQGRSNEASNAVFWQPIIDPANLTVMLK